MDVLYGADCHSTSDDHSGHPSTTTAAHSSGGRIGNVQAGATHGVRQNARPGLRSKRYRSLYEREVLHLDCETNTECNSSEGGGEEEGNGVTSASADGDS